MLSNIHKLKKHIKYTIITGLSILSLFTLNLDNVHADNNNQLNQQQIAQLVNGKSATQLAQLIKEHKLTSQQLIDYDYAQIQQKNGQLNAVINVNKKSAEQQLKQLEKHGSHKAPFYGVPILIKGIAQPFKGAPYTEGLTFEKGNTYKFTGPFVKRLQKMGFIVIGETNFPEQGLINITNSILNGVAHNPWNLDHNTGGSSGGACASVADNIVPVATGNDAGGSLRIPASYCGTLGLKPSEGVIVGDPQDPSIVNFAETKNIHDSINLFNQLTTTKGKKAQLKVPKHLNKLTVAYSTTSPVGSKVSPDAVAAVNKAVSFLRSQGFKCVKVNAPVNGKKLMMNYFEASALGGGNANKLARQKLHRNLKASDVTNHVVSPMTYALYKASLKMPKDADQNFGQEVQTVTKQMNQFHKKYPLYLTPTTAIAAPKNDNPAFLPKYVEQLKHIGTLNHTKQIKLIYRAWFHGLSQTPFTQLANLSGEPAISLPIYVNKDGLPLGVQFEASHGGDMILLRLGLLFQNHNQFIFK